MSIEEGKWEAMKLAVDAGGHENDLKADGLPLITEPTMERLLSEYGVQNDFRTQSILSSMSPDLVVPPFSKGIEVASTIFNTLVTIDDVFPKKAVEWLDRNFRQPYEKNFAAVGMGAVIRAYEIQDDEMQLSQPETDEPNSFTFLRRFKNISHHEWFAGFNKSKVEWGMIVRTEKPAPQIPDHQVNLATFLDRFVNFGVPSPHEPVVKAGASSMYHALEHVWDKGIQRDPVKRA